MANNTRKRLTASVRFNFTETTNKPLIIIQFVIILAIIVVTVVWIVMDGVDWFSVALLALWLFCGYSLIKNARRAFGKKENARENAIPELELITPVPDREPEEDGDSKDT